MKRIFFLILLAVMSTGIYAQTDDKGYKEGAWVLNGVTGLNLSQTAMTNWSAGGENALSGNAYLNGSLTHKNGNWLWVTNLILDYGLSKTKSQGMRKTTDKIGLSTQLGYSTNNVWYYTLMGDLNTQFAKGYNYPDKTHYISNFFAPAYSNISVHCQKILSTQYSEKLDELYRLGGTSGGARPKIMTEIDGENWIIKFPAHVDKKDVGKMEYDYSLCAKACGIVMSETRLFSSDICPGYFGTKRFDRRIEKNEIKRAHMLTAAALLELDFNQPSLDYHELMKLTKILTRDCTEDVENMYRRMCFNVFAHNRDDHSKNFTYIYNEKDDMWRLSPAYDLTYSNTYYGEHTTTVDGNGKNPGKKELVAVGVQAGMKKTYCERVAEEIRLCVNEKLEHYLK